MSNHQLHPGQLRFRRAGLFLTAAGSLALAGAASGQEALRVSMAGDLAAEAQHQADSTIGYYNLLLGPTAWRFSSGLGTEYDDNVRLQENGESDLIIRPSINTQMHWPVSLKNSLDLSVAAGYSEYLQHSDLSQFYINPGSGLSFDVFAGDFKINLHDRIAITEEAYENAGVTSGNQDLVSLQNTAGTSALWDLGKALINAGYDHVNYVSLGQNQGYPDASSENLMFNGGVRMLPELLMGVEMGGSVITYSQNSTSTTLSSPGATQWNLGGFASEKVSEYIDCRLDAGYTVYTPDNSEAGLVTADTSGFYFSLSLSHHVNQFLSYTLSAGRTTDLGNYGQGQSYYYVRLDTAWNLFKNYTLTTPIWWQQGTWLYNNSTGVSDYQQIGAGLNVTRLITQKLSASVGYQFVQENSGQTGLNYTVNTLQLNLSYHF